MRQLTTPPGGKLRMQEFWVCWRLNNKQCSSPYTGAKPIKHAVQLEENGGLKLAFSRFSNICKMLMVERKWRQELENYLLATEKDENADKIKIAILLNLLGSEVLEIFNTFKFEPPESQKNYSEVLKKFEEYCSPRQNATDNGLKERLLRESGLGLEKAIEIVRAAETSREQLRSMKEETAVTVNSVKRNRNQNQPKQSSQE
ncbi:hypothetical protein AVEN_211579-1 [Araneus ventricosus]|uniref:Uncharacterized protein n=1 Tax=Araneus ventricosus TaxID=182803 RepID=A0A4Y2D6U3_ARAVE|nr:hypothetical protein AVEN_211579-1 [Araneus ventricosus]